MATFPGATHIRTGVSGLAAPDGQAAPSPPMRRPAPSINAPAPEPIQSPAPPAFIASPAEPQEQCAPFLERIAEPPRPVAAPATGFDSTRLLAILAVIGGVGIFGYATIFPDPWRTGTAIAYALAVIVPTIWLLGRRQ